MPRPDVVMDPPVVQESPEPPQLARIKARAISRKGVVNTPACPRTGTATNTFASHRTGGADRHHHPYEGTRPTTPPPRANITRSRSKERTPPTPSPIRFLRTGVPPPGRLLFVQTPTSGATDASPSPQHTSGGIFPSPTPMLLSDMGGSRGTLPAKKRHRHCPWPPPHRHKKRHRPPPHPRQRHHHSKGALPCTNLPTALSDATDRGTYKATANAPDPGTTRHSSTSSMGDKNPV